MPYSLLKEDLIQRNGYKRYAFDEGVKHVEIQRRLMGNL
jgi:hypothetical protein